MPRLRLLVGMNVGGESREAGSVVEVPGDVAKYLIDLGRVELVRGEQPETPERARRTEKTATAARKRRGEVETR